MSQKKSSEKSVDSSPIVISPNQLKMFPDYTPTVPTPVRPTKNTLDKEPIYETITRLVMEWAYENDDRFDDYLKITKKVFYSADFSDDAYELAKSYEKLGCQSDVYLVNLLDDLSFIVNSEQEKQVAAWVKKYEVKSLFSVGDKVHRENKPNLVGNVRAVYHETAKIGINWDNSNESITILPQEYFIINK